VLGVPTIPILLERHDQLDLPTYCRIAFEREPVTLTLADSALDTVQRARQAFSAGLESGASAYGVNTGLGYLAARDVNVTDQAAFQRAILAGRAAGFGRRLSEPVVRGAMLLRLTGFLSGHAGVSPELCRFICERLNEGWYPVVPGGVTGAAGEIVPLAHLFATLVGDGSVVVDARIVPAGAALAADGIAPYELGAKEGIALINGAPLAPAIAVPLLLRAQALLEQATLAGAVAIAVTGASARPYVERVGRLKGDAGQLEIDRRLSSLLAPLPDRLRSARQAPVSLRVIPQVHGAASDMLDHLRDQLARELRAVTDSPVFLPELGDQPEGLYSTGNFHASSITLLLDAVAVAFTHVLNLLEKRLHRLLDSRFSSLPDQLSGDPGRQSGVVILHKQVIGLVAQARTLAAPASIHAADASTGQEDIQAHTLLAAAQLDGILAALELSLAHELVALRQARFLAGSPLPVRLEAAVGQVADIVPGVAEDRALAGDVERARELVASGRLVPDAPRWVPLYGE
jgi:histidine ammonia-lyase